MRVLQIANDYLNPLFSKMFTAIGKKGVQYETIVPIARDGIEGDWWEEEVKVLRCFSSFDRYFFFHKQRKIIKSIISNVDISKFSLIHAHTLFSAGYAAMVISKEYGIPYVVAVRNTDVNVFFKRMPWLRNTGLNILKCASAIIFLSSAYRNNLVYKYVNKGYKQKILDKSLVIPNGIADVFFNNINAPKEYNTPGKLTILFVGEVTKNKNIDTILQVAHLREKCGEQVRVNIIGDVIDTECAKLLEDPLVEYHNRLSQEALIHYFRNADIFLMPSHTETFGLVYAEAMSQGLPILYTKGQGFDGYFEDGFVGYKVDDKSVQDINLKINSILSNYSEISTNCIESCQRFSWDMIALEYKLLYEKCCC